MRMSESFGSNNGLGIRAAMAQRKQSKQTCAIESFAAVLA